MYVLYVCNEYLSKKIMLEFDSIRFYLVNFICVQRHYTYLYHTKYGVQWNVKARDYERLHKQYSLALENHKDRGKKT